MRFGRSCLGVILALTLSAPLCMGQWKKFDAGTDASFRGLDVVSKKVVWASGTGGTVIRTIDGGANWQMIRVPGAEKLDFRDIEAFNADTAYVLSIGNGDTSRIYKTTDGGKNWELQFTNRDENAFFDSIAFWDSRNGIAQSDPVGGRYLFYTTSDGNTWQKMPEDGSPTAKEGEAAFAASGTSILAHGKNGLFLITGGMDARVLYSPDRGKTWRSTSAPMNSGSAGAGVFGIAMKGKRGVIVGGDYTKPELDNSNIAYSEDGGRSWQTRLKANSFGYRSGVAFVTDKTIVIVGPGGSDISFNSGQNWKGIDDGNYNSVAATGKESIWAVGPKGLVARLDVAGLEK